MEAVDWYARKSRRSILNQRMKSVNQSNKTILKSIIMAAFFVFPSCSRLDLPSSSHGQSKPVAVVSDAQSAQKTMNKAKTKPAEPTSPPLLKKVNNTAEQTAQKPSTLAVLRFNNNTGDESVDWLGAGIAETLTTELAASGKFRVIEKEQIDKVIGELKFELSGLVDPSTAQEIGNILGVEYVILGSYQKISDVYRIMARKVETKSGEVQTTTTVTGPEAEIFDLQEKLAHKMLANAAL